MLEVLLLRIEIHNPINYTYSDNINDVNVMEIPGVPGVTNKQIVTKSCRNPEIVQRNDA